MIPATYISVTKIVEMEIAELIKFTFSEKATKIDKIFTVNLTQEFIRKDRWKVLLDYVNLIRAC